MLLRTLLFKDSSEIGRTTIISEGISKFRIDMRTTFSMVLALQRRERTENQSLDRIHKPTLSNLLSTYTLDRKGNKFRYQEREKI